MTNAQPILDKLTDGDDFTHRKLVQQSHQLAIRVDKALTVLKKRQEKYSKVKALKDEMAQAMEHMDDDNYNGRSVTKIAGDLKRANNAIDNDVDKVLDKLDGLSEIQEEVVRLSNLIGSLSFMDELA